MIVVDTTALQTGHRYRGIGTYTAGLLDALTRCTSPAPLGLLLQGAHRDDLPVVADLAARRSVEVIRLHKLPWRRDRLQWLVSGAAIAWVLYGLKPRIYHAVEPNGLVRVPGVRTVATLHDLIPLHDPAAHFPARLFDQRLGYARYLHELRRVDRIIANSQATKADAVDRLRIPPERVAVTLLAVDETRFYPRSPTEIAGITAKYRLRRPYFLHVGAYVGPFDAHKNTAAILGAFDVFCRRTGGDYALYFVGKWSDATIAGLSAAYPALVESRRVRVLGFVPDDDLPILYSGADALVYPSLIEGFGFPVLEAMRCGTPVLTSRTSSLPEVGGDAALYIDPRNVDEIAVGLERLAGERTLRADLATRGLQRAASFTWERTAAQTVRVYEEML